METRRTRRSRWLGLIGLAGRRVWTRATRTAPRQSALMLAGIAIPVALMFVVTSVSLGLTGGATVASPGIDYWIVPEERASSSVVSVGGPQFGDVHSVANRLSQRPAITAASPVLISLLRAEVGGTEEFVLAVGLIPDEVDLEISGVSTAPMTNGDPHFANGTYSGEWTDEAVVSNSLASLFDVKSGASLRLHTGTGTNQTLDVLAVEGKTPSGGLPVVVVHLSELQSLTGNAAGDRADQILVKTNDRRTKSALQSVYPRSLVLTRGGLNQRRLFESELALAMALAALSVAVIIGVLFSMTTIGMSVADRVSERAVLAALGITSKSRAAIVSFEALIIAFVGGLIGIAGGLAALPIVNYAVRRWVADVTVARFHELLPVYGIFVAGLIGLLVVPYLLFIGRRTFTMEVLYD